MLGLGFTEILFLGLLALILIGPEDLPKIAKTLGRFMNEVKRGGDSFRRELEISAQELEQKTKVTLDPVSPNPPAPTAPVAEGQSTPGEPEKKEHSSV